MRTRTVVGAYLASCVVLGTSVSAQLDLPNVVIDAGHGGPAGTCPSGIPLGDADQFNSNGVGYNECRGAQGPDEGLTEQWVNLRIARTLEGLLPAFYNVVMTRWFDTDDVSLASRVAVGAAFQNDVYKVFVSIHHNGLPPTIQGTETWYSTSSRAEQQYVPTSIYFAGLVQDELVNAYGYNDRGTKDDAAVGSGCGRYIVCHAAIATALGEASNLAEGNGNEEDNLLTSWHRDAQAEAYDDAITTFFDSLVPIACNNVASFSVTPVVSEKSNALLHSHLTLT